MNTITSPTIVFLRYRPEIQGLRAVAALLVAIYHIWLGRVSGGVDVFFAVSGFLITASLLQQVETLGRIDFAAFWERLARRLLPVAMLVLFVVLVAVVLCLPRPLWKTTIPQIFASLLQLENWVLAFAPAGFIDRGQFESPVMHYWALSVQWQFYLLWPCLFAAAMLIAQKAKLPLKSVLIYFVAVVFSLSFVHSVLATRSNQSFTYFNTLARLWEFCLGAVLALMPAWPIHRWLRVVVGWGGLSGIMVCGLVFPVSEVFPGYVALWPVSCALLIIMAGTSGSAVGADRLLASRPLVFLGGASYALYLWHWPVLVFYRWFTDQQSIGLADGTGVIAISMGLALLTSKLFGSTLRS